ncbi:MAG: glycosyltransferase family 39 protein [Chloroflexota bacterium]
MTADTASPPDSLANRAERLEAAMARRVWLWVLPLAAMARLPGLMTRPLWYDEAFAALFSSKGPLAMLRGTLAVESGVAADVHPLLYYSLLWLWQKAFGASPVSVRMLSVIFGLAVVVLGVVLARRLFDERAAVWAGMLLALSSFQVHYSQEARMYALLAFWLLLATALLWRALHSCSPWNWIGFALAAAAAQYTHNLAFCYLLALAVVAALAGGWRGALRTLLAGAGTVLLYLPWLIRLPLQLARIEQGYWIQAPGAADIVRTLLVFVAGLPVAEEVLPAVVAATVLAIAVAAMPSLRAWRSGDPRAGRVGWVSGLATLPVLVMFAVSQWRPVYLDRALLPAGTMFLLWLAWALRRGSLSRALRLTAALGLLVALLLGLWGTYAYRGFPYAPYPLLTDYLRSNLAPGERIVHSNKITALPAVYYGPGLPHHYIADPPGSGSDTLARATQEVLGLLADADAAEAAGGAPGVWFVIFPREIEEYRALGVAEHPALAWLSGHYRFGAELEFGEVRLYHFVLPEGNEE